jgi:hypothetical protein
MSKDLRELTRDEVRKRFLDQMWMLVEYWEYNPSESTRDKLEGLLHSILVVLDGEGGYLPSFKMIPSPHPDDKEYMKQIEENWYPDNCDIGGGLHDAMYNNYNNHKK